MKESLVEKLVRRVRAMRGADRPFTNSATYWENRYRAGRTSGAGSAGALAEFKARVLNDFVASHKIRTVLELGCGDGAQLSRAVYPSYFGLDVSERAITLCQRQFRNDPTKTFLVFDTLLQNVDDAGHHAELCLSLDVIYHLVEDDVFDAYMRSLFGAAERFVVVYSSNSTRESGVSHVRHRKFTDWVEAHADAWALTQRIPNEHPLSTDNPTGSFADFYVFARRATDEAQSGADPS